MPINRGPVFKGGIVQISDMVRLFSGSFFTKRLEPDYVSHMPEYMAEIFEAFQAMGPFWQLPGQ